MYSYRVRICMLIRICIHVRISLCLCYAYAHPHPHSHGGGTVEAKLVTILQQHVAQLACGNHADAGADTGDKDAAGSGSGDGNGARDRVVLPQVAGGVDGHADVVHDEEGCVEELEEESLEGYLGGESRVGATTEGGETDAELMEGEVTEGEETEDEEPEGEMMEGEEVRGEETESEEMEGELTEGEQMEDEVMEGEVTEGEETEDAESRADASEMNIESKLEIAANVAWRQYKDGSVTEAAASVASERREQTSCGVEPAVEVSEDKWVTGGEQADVDGGELLVGDNWDEGALYEQLQEDILWARP